eukprot:2384095-Amphidinium_carterae.1
MHRQGVVLTTACGGPKITQLLSELSALRELSPYTSTQRQQPIITPTISLTSSNMALPKVAAQVELCEPILPALAADILAEKDIFLLPLAQRPRPARSFLQ